MVIGTKGDVFPNVTYNIADLVNQIVSVLTCWPCAKVDSAANIAQNCSARERVEVTPQIAQSSVEGESSGIDKRNVHEVPCVKRNWCVFEEMLEKPYPMPRLCLQNDVQFQEMEVRRRIAERFQRYF